MVIEWVLGGLLGLSLITNIVLGRLLAVKTAPARKDAAIAVLIAEGVTLAEQSLLKGPDRFRIARAHVYARAKVMKLDLSERDIALRIEAAVKGPKLAQKALTK